MHPEKETGAKNGKRKFPMEGNSIKTGNMKNPETQQGILHSGNTAYSRSPITFFVLINLLLDILKRIHLFLYSHVIGIMVILYSDTTAKKKLTPDSSRFFSLIPTLPKCSTEDAVLDNNTLKELDNYHLEGFVIESRTDK